ncbi:MAG: hypothetical protein ACYC9U_07570 [Nitrososphaerales archaeon]
MLDVLSIRRKYSQELMMLAADTASRLSYGRSGSQLIRSNPMDIPKATLLFKRWKPSWAGQFLPLLPLVFKSGMRKNRMQLKFENRLSF